LTQPQTERRIMKQVRAEEKIELLSTVIGAVLTLAIGTGLSILLGGIVRGFAALAVLSIGLLIFLVRRDFISIEL
jgi:hypothetical protein